MHATLTVNAVDIDVQLVLAQGSERRVDRGQVVGEIVTYTSPNETRQSPSLGRGCGDRYTYH